MRWAYLTGLVVAFLLPKRIDCSAPGERCTRRTPMGLVCTRYEIEPWGLYVAELAVGHDVGFAYSRQEDCR
jgi:hypothetical protein